MGHFKHVAKSETDIENEIVTALNQYDDIYVFRQKSYSKLKGGTTSGVADLIVNYAFEGLLIVIYMEVKTPNGKQLPSQKKFQDIIESMGGLYYIVRSVHDAEHAIENANDILSIRF